MNPTLSVYALPRPVRLPNSLSDANTSPPALAGKSPVCGIKTTSPSTISALPSSVTRYKSSIVASALDAIASIITWLAERLAKACPFVPRRLELNDPPVSTGGILGRALSPSFSRRLIAHNPASHDCIDHFSLWNVVRIHLEYVLRQHDDVGQKARRQHSLLALRELGKSAIRRVGPDSFFDGYLLLRHPTLWILSIDSLARYRSINPKYRRQWSYCPIRSKCQVCPGIDERTERVGCLYAVRSDSLLRPAAVVDRMIGLNRRNHSQLCEARDIRGQQVLGVFDAEPAVTSAISLLCLFKVIQDDVIGFITNRMHRALEACCVGIDDVLFQFALGNIVVGHQPGGVRRIRERLKEQGGRRTERPVHERLQAAQAQPLVAPPEPRHQISLPTPRPHRSARVNSHCKPAGIQESLVDFVIGPQRYVLN